MDSEEKTICSIVEKYVKERQKGVRPEGSLSEALGIKTREMISLAGAGGKTTLMFRLAGELFLNGKKVVTTTTTKILEPASGETDFLLISSDETEVKQFISHHLDEYRHVTVAKERLESGKLRGISTALVHDLWNAHDMDCLIIEADGAAGRPVKAPREGEPVFPTRTTLVVGILGVDGVGMELNEENVFQAGRVSKVTGVPIGKSITEEAMAVLMTHPEGIFRGTPSSSRIVVFLNKVDVPGGVVKAKKIAQKIIEKRHDQIERVVLGKLKSELPVAEVIFP